MNYKLSDTPTIDEIVVKTLIIPLISPDLNPLDALEVVKEAIEQALNTDTPTDELSELTEHFKSYSQTRLKAALRYVKSRIAAAAALDEYLFALYQDSVGKDSEMTPHSEPESTPRLNAKAVLNHLRYDFLQGTEDDIRGPDQVTEAQHSFGDAETARKSTQKHSPTPTQKAFKSSDITCFLIADLLTRGKKKYRKSEEAGALNINSVSKAVQEHASRTFPSVQGQSDASIRDRLNNGKNALAE